MRGNRQGAPIGGQESENRDQAPLRLVVTFVRQHASDQSEHVLIRCVFARAAEI
jgi:hypothetical protein